MRLLVLNQYFPPDRAATAILLGQLALGLAEKGHQVDVLCASPTYNPDPNPRPLAHPNLMLHRIPSQAVSRAHLLGRVWAYLRFTLKALGQLRRLKGPYDAVLVWTDPPWLAWVALRAARRFRCPVLWTTQDVYPHIAQYTGHITPSVTLDVLHMFFGSLRKRVDHIIAIGPDMKSRFLDMGVPGAKISVIPNWQDETLLTPTDPSVFRRSHQIPQSAFVVMHSGNIGHSQDFERLLEAAYLLKAHADIVFLLIGQGARKDELLKEMTRRGLWNVKWFPYQSESDLSASLSCADLHYVSLKANLWGYIVPSKIYALAALGKPILGNLPQPSYLHELITSYQIGINVGASAEALAETILRLQKDRESLTRMGQHARQWFEAHATKAQAVASYETLIANAVRDGSPLTPGSRPTASS